MFSVQEKAFLSDKHWYYHAQTWLKDTYLQPFSFTSNGSEKSKRNPKKNTRNGYIEREVHGAMHASRVALSTTMLHRLCAQQYPSVVAQKFNTVAQFFNLTEEELLCLIRYVALGHDAAREGDGYDRWETQSGLSIQHFLESHGIASEKAILFSSLAVFKDKPEVLNVQAQGMPQEVIEGLQYARLLISLSDCFDIIRCNGQFNFKYIEKMLSTVFDYQKERDGAIFFEYAKQLLSVIKAQQDLYFPTKLIGPDDEVFQLEEGEADFSVRSKVKLEHAPNAIVAMQTAFQHHPYFSLLLFLDAPPAHLEEATVNAAFNPYIHGSNSSTLALMTMTDFQLMSSVDMLEQYQVAPFCGELTAGGLSHAQSDGRPCFARLNGDEANGNEYTLKKVIQNYAKAKTAASQEKCQEELLVCYKTTKETLFSSINVLNIYLTRLKQLGVDLKTIPEIQTMEEDFRQASDIFYLYLLFSTHILAKKNDLTDPQLWDLEDNHLIQDKILGKLKHADISVKAVYHNPTQENCQKIIDILNVPEAGFSALFEYTTTPNTNRGESPNLKTSSYTYVFKGASSWSFESLCCRYISGDNGMGAFQGLAHHLFDYITILENRFEVTRKLLDTPIMSSNLCTEDAELVHHSFPIIFAYDQDQHMRIVDMHTQEYRAQQPLKLGQNIQVIATDSEENQRRLQAYSDRYGLNLSIITFNDLKYIQRSLSTEYPLSLEQAIESYIGLSAFGLFSSVEPQQLVENNTALVHTIEYT